MRVLINDCFGSLVLTREARAQYCSGDSRYCCHSLKDCSLRTNEELIKRVMSGEDLATECCKLMVVEVDDAYADYFQIMDRDGHESFDFMPARVIIKELAELAEKGKRPSEGQLARLYDLATKKKNFYQAKILYIMEQRGTNKYVYPPNDDFDQ